MLMVDWTGMELHIRPCVYREDRKMKSRKSTQTHSLTCLLVSVQSLKIQYLTIHVTHTQVNVNDFLCFHSYCKEPVKFVPRLSSGSHAASELEQ